MYRFIFCLLYLKSPVFTQRAIICSYFSLMCDVKKITDVSILLSVHFGFQIVLLQFDISTCFLFGNMMYCFLALGLLVFKV